MTAAAGQFFIRVRAANYIEHLREVTVNGSGAIAVELDPVFEPVTTTTDLSVSGGSQCPGWWDGFGPSSPCKAVASVDVHHAGPLKARVTWPHKNDVPHIVLYAVESDGVSLEPIDSTEETPHAVSAEVAAHRQYVIHVRMYSFGGGPPSAGPRQFQLTIARPN
jgi:hypothetical protein